EGNRRALPGIESGARGALARELRRLIERDFGDREAGPSRGIFRGHGGAIGSGAQVSDNEAVMAGSIILALAEIGGDSRGDRHSGLQPAERLDPVEAALRRLEANFLRLVAAYVEIKRMAGACGEGRSAGLLRALQFLLRRLLFLRFFTRGLGPRLSRIGDEGQPQGALV